LPFHFTLALTGALLGLSTIIVAVLALLLYPEGGMKKVYELFLDAPPPVDARTVPMPDIAALIAEARRQSPEAAPQNVVVERPGRADMRVAVHGARAKLLVQQDETRFDATGKAIAQEHPEDFVAGTRILGGIGQLHFGWYGGLPVRLAYGLLGIALCVVTSSGVTIWLARRRDRGRAAPQWERIWAAVCWGQPAILALTALLAWFVPSAPLPGVWLALTVLSILASALARDVPGASLSRIWRWVLVVLLVALALLHGAVALPKGGSLLMDGLLLAGALGVLAMQLRSRAAPIPVT
jgi:hypothetical protein